MTASQFPGVPGTNGPLTAPIVYVGQGRASDYEGKDVEGKLVLIESGAPMNLAGHEAKIQGAVGVVFTRALSTAPDASNDALVSNEVRWSLRWPPAVYISANDGAWLEGRLDEGPVSATVSSDVKSKMHDFAHPRRGGVGFNVVGEIPGTDPNAKAILLAAHHDAYFRAGLDSTGAVAQLLTIAKAMKMSGTRLRRPLIFLVTSGEEFGYTNTQYDYLAGAWYAATVSHASSARRRAQRWTGPRGRVALMINIEESPERGGPLIASATPDLGPWLARVAAREGSELLPNGYIPAPYVVWHDGWTFTAAGVPAVVTVAETPSYGEKNHTTDDTTALIDYDYLGRLVKFYHRLASTASKGLLPHDVAAQAAGLAASVSAPQFEAAGANPRKVDALVAAVRRYQSAAEAYAARKPQIPRKRWARVNDRLTALERYWYTHLSSMSAGDDVLIFPFQQTVFDLERLKAAIGHLEANPAETEAAVDDLMKVGLTANGRLFSPRVYRGELRRHLPDHHLLNWGAQTNQFWHVDITDQVRLAQNGQSKAAIAGLERIMADMIRGADVPGARTRSVHIDGLNERLADVTAALEVMTPMVNRLR